MHSLIEQSTSNEGGSGSSEQRLYASVLGWRVSGQYDYFDSDAVIWDWKSASVREIEQGVKDSREQQLNCYAHLATANGIEVKGLRVGFILRDWSKIQAATTPGYPPHQVMVYPIPLWEHTERQTFIEGRVRLHQAARVTLPDCTEEERWASPDMYAVIKKGNKRASKLFEDATAAALDASRRGIDYKVEVRNGDSVRCRYYCPVESVCSQWQALK